MRAAEISKQLAARADNLVPYLLPAGRRAGNYWQAGDAHGAKGASLYVHMAGVSCGRWRDAATGEHGDLLDLIAIQQGVPIKAAMQIAANMLGNAPANPSGNAIARGKTANAPRDTRKAAIALWDGSRALTGGQGQAYLAARGLTVPASPSLRFHPGAWVDVTGQKNLPYATTARGKRRLATLPAIIAAVRDGIGVLLAVHRTFLDPAQPVKAQIHEPKRALGALTGGACWLRRQSTSLIVAEGIETALAVGMAFPASALAAGITSHHMTEMEIPPLYRRILIAADNDDAGRRAAMILARRMQGRYVRIAYASGADFNDDLLTNGLTAMRESITQQVTDANQYTTPALAGGGERRAVAR